MTGKRFERVWDAIEDTAEEAEAMKRLSAVRRVAKMKDGDRGEAMAELFKDDPAFVAQVENSFLDDRVQDDLQMAFPQMDKAGLFDRVGVLYEVACDVLGAIIAHYSEALAQEREKPVPDVEVVERIESTKRALRFERNELDHSDEEAIKGVIQKYASQARELYRPEKGAGL